MPLKYFASSDSAQVHTAFSWQPAYSSRIANSEKSTT